jgi:serine/threonine protein kinase
MGGACSGAIAPLSIMTMTSMKQQHQQRENYQIQSVIGKGGYAVVYRGKTPKKQEVAIKRTIFVNPEENEREIDMTLAELNALERVGQHPFITQMHSAFHEKNSCYLVLDYQSGGDLRYHLKTYLLFEEQHVAYFVSCIGSALNHLHQRGIIHRDIKPENILLSANGVPKLSDFGTAYVEETLSVPVCTLSSGTLPYMAPEMLTRSKHHSYQSDYWSLGVMAYELLFNCRPSLRNCPKRFIYFSANQYRCLWERLGSQSPSSTDSPVDFESVDQTISLQDREAVLPFPNASTPLLSEGDELPFELTTPIPLQTYAGERVSQECQLFLQSMLDVRVPQRLGQLSQFQAFSEHPWFRSHQCVISPSSGAGETPIQALPSSPYQPNLVLLESHLQTKYRGDPLLQSPSSTTTSSSCEVVIPEHIEKKLQCYSFSSSSSSSQSSAGAASAPHIAKTLAKTSKPPLPSLSTASSYDSSEENFPRSRS